MSWKRKALRLERKVWRLEDENRRLRNNQMEVLADSIKDCVRREQENHRLLQQLSANLQYGMMATLGTRR